MLLAKLVRARFANLLMKVATGLVARLAAIGRRHFLLDALAEGRAGGLTLACLIHFFARFTLLRIARPFVCLFGAINPANGRLIVYDEISQAGLTDSQQAEAIKMRSDENEMKARRFADPKMWNKQSVNDKLMSTADVYQAHGVKIYPGDPNRHAKKARVHELLAIRPDGYPGLIITPECKQLIKQLQKLMTAKDDPEDVNDHQEDDSYDAFGMLTNPVGKYNKPYKRVRPNANNKSPFQALERI